MKLLFIISFLMFPALAIAQEEGVDSSSECAEVLAAPPFVDMLTRNDRNAFRELSPLKSGRALLGLECSVDDLTEFFEGAGWEFLQFEKTKLLGPFNMGGAVPDYYIDAIVDFRLKRSTLFGMFDFGGRPMVSVYFHEGRISGLDTAISK